MAALAGGVLVVHFTNRKNAPLLFSTRPGTRPRPGYLVTFDLDLVIINEGARHCAVFELYGTISKLNGDSPQSGTQSVKFKWDQFMQNVNIAQPGESTRLWTQAESRVGPIDIAGHAAFIKKIRFCTTQSLKLTGGRYRIELVGIVHPSKSVASKAVRTVCLTADEIASLEKKPLDSEERVWIRPQFNEG